MLRSQDKSSVHVLEDAAATAEVLFSLGVSEARAIALSFGTSGQRRFVQRLTTAVLDKFWQAKLKERSGRLGMRRPLIQPLKTHTALVRRITDALLQVSEARAGFLVGQLYTQLLPNAEQKKLGAYYTPPPLVERLLDSVERAGFDWTSGTVIDPACGGAAFLAPLASRILARTPKRVGVDALVDVENRLFGAEIDPFAGWISEVLLDVALLDASIRARRLPKIQISKVDSLSSNDISRRKFDLVIGNPPYGRVTLSSEDRERFRRSLFGHANLYGLFTDLAVDLANRRGLVALVTPTSFLGGEYFKNLRKLLATEAPLTRLDFISDREGVFHGVLQETLLAVFEKRRARRETTARINVLHPDGPNRAMSVEEIGSYGKLDRGGAPWLLPRSKSQGKLLKRMAEMPRRLADYGFRVSTGQLVWNRHKSQLRAKPESGVFPIVWAEAVAPDGSFEFQAARRNHLPYLKLTERQSHLVNYEPCILVQRTTAKEQRRRLISTVIPNSFVLEYPGYVVENHLNMVYRDHDSTAEFGAISALLNSYVLDQAFRCINGSVAVSAYELNALPLPDPEQMAELQDAIHRRLDRPLVEELIASFYRHGNGNGVISTSAHTGSRHRKVAA